MSLKQDIQIQSREGGTEGQYKPLTRD